MDQPKKPDPGKAGKASRKPSALSRAALALDAFVDSGVWSFFHRLGEIWESITIAQRRLHVAGWKRGVVEIASEGMTMAAGGAVVMLALAIPAFQETREDWRNQGDFSVTFTDRYGNEIGQRGILQGESIPVDDLPDIVIKATLATEDRRFFEHTGIDYFGLFRAMVENVLANSVEQGGSTITQQLAKNLFLTNERTIERKVKEAFLSIWLEANLTKKEILQEYLDRAYMGGGTFGISAASEFYFGKKVKDLTLAEAAMLAGLFKAPTKYAPHINLPAARARANEVLTNMVQAGMLTEGQVLPARLRPASIIDRGAIKSPDYFLDWAFDEAKRLGAQFGARSMVARTTIDLDLQRAAEEATEFHLRQFGQEYHVSEGAIVLLENDGAVRAIVGGRDYGASQFNRATRAQRQVGSSFKPFVYATAMENGFEPNSVISDGPICWGTWCPKNYGRGYAGRVTLASALARSINTVPVRLAHDHLGIDAISAMTTALGVESKLNDHKTMVLGTSGLTVMDMATAYNSFANGGFVGTRHGITQLRDRSGHLIYDYVRDNPAPRRVLSEKADHSMNQMMALVPEAGTGRRAALPGIRSAGKTGTTQSYRDAWYVGFTGNYTAAVWLGNDDFSKSNDMTGGSLPAMTWQRLMTYVHQNVTLRPIPGLEPLPPVEPAPAAEKPAEVVADAPIEAPVERPRTLSRATTELLRRLADEFRAAPALTPPVTSASFSAQ
jgi:penicillin-binding protein 1A